MRETHSLRIILQPSVTIATILECVGNTLNLLIRIVRIREIHFTFSPVINPLQLLRRRYIVIDGIGITGPGNQWIPHLRHRVLIPHQRITGARFFLRLFFPQRTGAQHCGKQQ